MAERAAEVFVSIDDQDVLAGQLFAHRARRTESQTFRYAPEYIARPGAYALDPLLQLVEGPLHTPQGRKTFGAFSDCAPDRWGRRLVTRAERKRAEREGGAPRSFGEIDYLLGVRDDLRQGALRFRDPTSATYLADETSGVPSLLQLPTLLGAAERLESDEASEEELATLLRGGSSLGGARPKAHVLDGDGQIAIAKFPSPSVDEWEVTRWEAVALTLAGNAGIKVPAHQLHEIDEKPVLIVDRFDREGDERVGYVSAMTMLDRADGEEGSYLEIAEVIEGESPHARADLHELWRRVAFSILISNFDDHLRNHGFLRTSSAGWALSPAFDMNPDPRPGERHLNTAIDLDSTEARIDLLVDVAGYFRLQPDAAKVILGEVISGTAGWQSAADDCGVEEVGIDVMRPAFEHDEAERAHQLAYS